MSANFYIPGNMFMPFIKWLEFNGIKPTTLTEAELKDQWATFCNVYINEGEE